MGILAQANYPVILILRMIIFSQLLKDKLSIAIFDENNKVIGALLSHDYTTDYEIADCPEPLKPNVEFDNGASAKFKK